MMQFIGFAFYLCISAFLLIVVPVMLHPTLPTRRKLFIYAATFLLLVPGALTLYYFLGAPMMAARHG